MKKKSKANTSSNNLLNNVSLLDLESGLKAGSGSLPNDKVRRRCYNLSKPKKKIIVTTKTHKRRVNTSTFVDMSAEPNNFNGRIRHDDPRNTRSKRLFLNMIYRFLEVNKTLSLAQLCCKILQKRLLSI